MTPTPVEMTLSIDATLENRVALVEAHKKALHDIDATLARLREQRALASGGLDLEMIALAESVIRVDNIHNWNRGEGHTAVSAAISDLAHGAPVLRRQTFATKSYDRWDGQRCDCEYGYGPRHGNIIFRIGLVDRDATLDPAELDAAVSYLVAIEAVAKAKKAALAHA